MIKAIGTQRKDFEYVTNLRREVIEIVEPFRSKVLNVDRRFERDEQLIEDLSTKLTRLDHEYTNKFKGILSMERTNELIKEIRNQFRDEIERMRERLRKVEMKVDVHHQKISKVDDFYMIYKNSVDKFEVKFD